ncbi:hypothetical protein JW877_09595 [bacterium]|nr:hypothetical protein [bacterium]
MGIFLILLLVFSLMSCAAHHHKVGNGAQGNQVVAARSWYILWGLVPLNEVDSQAMAGGAADYEIHTEVSPLDFVISILTGIVTVNSRTVTVTK